MPIRNIRFLQNNIMNTSEPSPDRFQKLCEPFRYLQRWRPSQRDQQLRDSSNLFPKALIINKQSMSVKHSESKKRTQLTATKITTIDSRLTVNFARSLRRTAQRTKKPLARSIPQIKSPLVTIKQICQSPPPQIPQDELECDPILLKNCSQVKQMYKNPRQQLQTVIIFSADLLFNEFSFWKDEQINPNLSSIYKNLSKNAGIVLLVRRQKTVQKIKLFCKHNELPLDAVYLIQNSAKICLGINFEPIVQEFTSSKTILCFNVLRTNLEQANDYYLLENKLPLTQGKRIKSYLIKTDQMQPNKLLQTAGQIVRGELEMKRVNLDAVFNNYIAYLKNYQEPIQRPAKSIKKMKSRIKYEGSNNPEQQIMDRIGELKRQWIPEISLTKQPTQGQSVHYIVGDLLKKNFKLMVSFHKQQSKASDNADYTTTATTLSRRNTITRVDDTLQQIKIQYDFPVYMYSL